MGEDNFTKIQSAVVLVAGAGGLGCNVLQLIARIGFGTIHIFDPGIVDKPDLNRQTLYNENDLGHIKADVAAANLKKINSDINVIAHKVEIENETLPPELDIAIDCLDSFKGRLVLENLFFNKGIPLIHGGATQFFGQVTTLIPGQTSGLSDIFGRKFMKTADIPPKDIFPPVVMNVASIQVSEAVKLVCGIHEEDLLINKIMTVDLLTNSFEVIKLVSD